MNTPEIGKRKAYLLALASELLDFQTPCTLDQDRLLARSGLTLEQVLDCFEDYAELLEQACLERYMLHMTFSVQAIRQLVHSSESLTGLRERLDLLDLQIHDIQRWTEPFIECAHIIGMARARPRMLTQLAKVQDDVTFGFAEVLHHAQQKGWVRPEIDDWTLAVFLEAIAFGRLLDGVSSTKLDPQEWLRLVHQFVDKVVLVEA